MVERSKDTRAPFPYAQLLNYYRGQADARTKEETERRLETEPSWRAHLDSVRYLDLEQMAARQDAQELAEFNTTSAGRFCRLVARSGGEVLVQLLREEESPLAGASRSEWEEHVLDCVYCRRMQRLAHAKQICLAHGLDESEPLLREWLLSSSYRAELDRVTRELVEGPRPAPVRTAATATSEEPKAAASPQPSSVRARSGATPEQLQALALRVRKGPGEESEATLLEGVEPRVRAYVRRLQGRGVLPAGASEDERARECLRQVLSSLPQWQSERQVFSAWLLGVCRACCGQDGASRSGTAAVPQRPAQAL